MIDRYKKTEKELEELGKEGGGLWTAEELALSFGVNRQTVYGWAREAGFEAPRGRGHRALYTSEDSRKILAERGKR